MTELERRLVSLGRELDYPPTPVFERAYDRPPVRAVRLRPLALGLAVLAAVLASVLALSPGARSAFLEIFELRGATVEHVETLPRVDAQRLDFGRSVSREEARRVVGFELLDLGEPNRVYVRDDRLASLVYGDPGQPRLVLSQLRGSIYEGFLKKAGGSGTSVEKVTVKGEPGLFISGDDHVVMFRDETGAILDERTYLAGTVLLWNRGPLLLRLEGDLTRAEALELAETVE